MIFNLGAIIATLVFIFSCKSKQHANDIVLKIILSESQKQPLVGKYIYLVDFSRDKLVDSALVLKDTVTFNQHWTPGFIPYQASVQRIDSFNGHSYLRPMGVQSPYDKSFVYSSFYLDTGTTIVKPHDRNNREYSDFIGSKQNEPFLKGVALQFSLEKSTDRHSTIKRNISKIKAYPYSINLLEQLFKDKENFLGEDLEHQLSFFNDDIKKTHLFKSFAEYFATLESHDKAFPSIKFENQKGEYQNIGGHEASYYLIVYWASWCVPCRQEIPGIKRLHEKFTNTGLSITSISIDGNRSNWQTAIEKEKMPWQQLIAIDSTKDFIDLHYNIKAIPKAYLFNRKKELIKTYTDALVMTRDINELFANAK
ncbi:MAG TPA: TlpA disulfide reductase family protein [Chitinophagaceae bacterium]|jgi:thiol-disulfide isomerase/thioredoxin|nr:TlpA disulfide reductase family protein [Chitinophagaceae bacterium]